MVRLLITLLAFAVATGTACAQTVFQWTGTSSSQYATGANWSGGTAPVNSASTTDLLFTGLVARPVVQLSSGTTTVHAIAVSNPATDYTLNPVSAGASTLALGSAGLTTTGSSFSFTLGSGLSLQLLASQTWSTGVNVTASGPITGAFALTKTGAGRLTLAGNSTFSGGLTVNSGSLYLGNSSTSSGGVVGSGPVGTGTLTLAGGTTIGSTSDFDVTLANALALSGKVTFGDATNARALSLTGNVTLKGNTTIAVPSTSATIKFLGDIGQSTASGLTVSGGGFASFGGNNSDTGGTTVSASVLTVLAAASLPAAGNVTVTGGGYVGVGTSGLLTTIISRITNPSASGSFNGSLGFETDLSAGNPATFNDALDLSVFNGNASFGGIGTFTRAIVSGPITVANNQDYKFGGGVGTLYVSSSLPDQGNAGLVVASSTATTGEDDHLAVFLQGTNTFKGNITVTAASLIIDGPSALPSGVAVAVAEDGYIGYTENSSVTNFADFASRITKSGSSRSSDSIVGIDSSTSTGRSVTDTIDLSSLGSVFFGTATKITLGSGSVIKSPSGGTLRLAGVDRGYLKIEAPLTTANGITSLVLGSSEGEPGDASYNGYIELSSASTNFTGNTTLSSGFLLLGASSTGAVGNMTVGPIGRGTLTINGAGDDGFPTLAASAAIVTLHNSFNTPVTTFTLGVAPTTDTTSKLFRLQSFTSNNLTLLGNITGGTPVVEVRGTGILTLGGSNVLGGVNLHDGGRVVVTGNSGLGAGPVTVYDGSDLRLTSLAPAIGSLSGGAAQGSDSSYLSLASGATLTINQSTDGAWSGRIGSDPASFGGSAAPAAVSASLIKTGTATLELSGDNTYLGTTTINSGTLLLTNLSGSATGAGDIAIGAAGTLKVGNGGANGGLSGNIANAGTAIYNRSDAITYGGTLSGAGAFIKQGDGTLTLTGNNTFTGTLTIAAGTLRVGATNTLPAAVQLSFGANATLDVANSQTIAGFFGASGAGNAITLGAGKTLTVAMPVANQSTTFAGSVSGDGVFAVSGAGGDVVNLTGNVTNTGGTSIGSGASLVIANGGSVSGPINTSGTLTFGGSGPQTVTGVISGTGSIAATAGTTTLSGANTYTGGTAITGGKIIVSNTTGSATGTGPVTVGTGGVLGGSGFISGPLTLSSGGTVSPGNSPGNLTVGNTTFTGGATFAFDVNATSGTAGTNWDLLSVTGTLTIASTSPAPFTINLTSLNSSNGAGLLQNFNFTQAYSWQFVSASGGIVGFTSPSVFTTTTSQFQNNLGGGSFGVTQVGNSLVLNFTPVPEPSTWCLIVAGLGAIGLAARRRTR